MTSSPNRPWILLALVSSALVFGWVSLAPQPRAAPEAAAALDQDGPDAPDAVEAMGLDPYVRLVVPAPGGERVFLMRVEVGVEETDSPRIRVFSWDPEARTVTAEVGLPWTPVHMAIVRDALVVACDDTGRIAIVDTATAKVVRTIPIRLPGLVARPSRVFPDSPTGTVLVQCNYEGARFDDRILVAVSLATDECTVIPGGPFDHAVFAGGKIACQRSIGMSSCGRCEVRDLSGGGPGWRDGSLAAPGTIPLDALQELGPCTAQGDSFVCTQVRQREVTVSAHESALEPLPPRVISRAARTGEIEWSADGLLLARRAGSSLAVAAVPAANVATTLPLSGIDLSSGRVLWRRTIGFAGKISATICGRALLEGDPLYLRVFGLSLGSYPTPIAEYWKARPCGVAPTRAAIVPGAGGRPDRLALCLSPFRITGSDEFSLELEENEAGRRWVWVPLPSSGAGR